MLKWTRASRALATAREPSHDQRTHSGQVLSAATIQAVSEPRAPDNGVKHLTTPHEVLRVLELLAVEIDALSASEPRLDTNATL